MLKWVKTTRDLKTDGKNGVGMRNDNGSRLVDFCDYNNLVITGTCFPHKEIHKLTWRSPDGQILNQIDHIIVSRQHRSSVMDTRVMRNADISSNHYPLPISEQS